MAGPKGEKIMKKYVYIKKIIIGSAIGAAALFGTATIAGAQNYSKEYLKLQVAKSVADTRHDKYMATLRGRDYRKWQRAQNRVTKHSNKLERAGFAEVYNVLEGFEGPLDENRHRGTLGGWRNAG